MNGPDVGAQETRAFGHPKQPARLSRDSPPRRATPFAVICAKPACVRANRYARRAVGLYLFERRGCELGERSMAPCRCFYPKDFSVDPGTAGASCWAQQNAGQGRPFWRSILPTDDGGPNFGNASAAKGRRLLEAIFHPTHAGWIYMTLTEGTPGAGLLALARQTGERGRPSMRCHSRTSKRVEFDPANDSVASCYDIRGQCVARSSHAPLSP